MEFREQVIQILVEKAAKMFGLDPSTLGPETRFKEDLGCKSANIVQFTTSLEDEFDVEVEQSEAAKSKTVGELITYLESVKQ